MDHFQSANHLLSHSSNSLKNIKDSYQKYLNAKEVSPILLIDIKNFMENLRSALDYTAHGLFDKYGDKS